MTDSQNRKIIINKKAMEKIQDFSNRRVQEYRYLHRNFILLLGTIDYLKQQGIEPNFEVEYPDDNFYTE